MPAVSEGTLVVEGLAGLDRAFTLAGKEFSREFRGELREIAEPVRAGAEHLAGSMTSHRGGPINLHEGDPWTKMRAVARRNLVYVAPVERGLRTKKNRASARPNLADLLMDRAMAPALEQHAPEVVAGVDRLLAHMGTNWETDL